MRCALAAVAAVLVWVPAANAATVSVDPEATASYVAAPGEANDLTVTPTAGTQTFELGSDGVIEAEAGCTQVSEREVACSADRVSVSLGDGDDELALGSGDVVPDAVPVEVSCGKGFDWLYYPGDDQVVPLDCERISYGEEELADWSLAGGPLGSPRSVVAQGRAPAACSIRSWTFVMKALRSPGRLLGRASVRCRRFAQSAPAGLRLNRRGRAALRRRGTLRVLLGDWHDGRINTNFILEIALKP